MYSHKKICGTPTKWLNPDTQLTVPISPTNLPEEFSWVLGVTHTLAQGACGCTLLSLSRVMKRLPGFEEIGMISASSNRQRSLWPGSFCLSLSSCDLQMTEIPERTVVLCSPPLCAVLQRSSWPLLYGTRPPTRRRKPRGRVPSVTILPWIIARGVEGRIPLR